MSETDLDNLLLLLDDEDNELAIAAMRELLRREDELGDRLAALQEADSPLLRKRIHQLQSAMVLRRRRRDFSRLLDRPSPDLAEGLIEVHLQWFDNDSRPGLIDLWESFREDADRFQPETLEGLSYFMRRRGMAAAEETAMQPENYCLGTIIDNNYGSAGVLCGIALALSESPELRIVRGLGEFGLLSGEGKLLMPRRDWGIMDPGGIGGLDYWDARSLLKYASTMLFSSAVNSDSLRYIQTIAQALLGTADGELPAGLPYPYRPAPESEGNEE